jgi:arginyl-tRNA synthetase
MPIREKIENLIADALTKQGVPKDMVGTIQLDHPLDSKMGDYSTNIAMVLVKSLGAKASSPIQLAQKIADIISATISGVQNSPIEKVTVAGPGFINFFLTRKFFVETVAEVLEKTSWYGKNTKLWNKKIIIEYTDPNPFKLFHIGHLMSNAIGESLSRILEFQDAKVSRATYGGDVGLHVAKSIWGLLQIKDQIPWDAANEEQIAFIGKAYVAGAKAYEEDETAEQEIIDLNKKIYERSDPEIDKIFIWGKKVSFDHFREIYHQLGSHFDYHFFESEMVADGLHIINLWLERGVFEKSDGAVIFPGEKYGLHNRVFINSLGLPTYEAKEFGLAKKKFEIHDFDQSIVITAHEQNDYYKVILKAMEQVFPEIANRTVQIGHGMMRFADGKMSSREGNVIAGEWLLTDVKEMVIAKIKDRQYTDAEKKDITEKVAVAAIKYSILKQSPGKDIIFDPDKSISFEGDSGPYLQYTYVRAKSVLAKAKEEGIVPEAELSKDIVLADFERSLYKFPEIVERAGKDFAPNYIATYITELASAFNSYYASNKIVDKNDPQSAHKVALTEAVSWVIKNGLYLLGILVPEKM